MKDSKVAQTGSDFTLTRTETVTLTETDARAHCAQLMRAIASLDTQTKRLADERQALEAELAQVDALLNIGGVKNPGPQ